MCHSGKNLPATPSLAAQRCPPLLLRVSLLTSVRPPCSLSESGGDVGRVSGASNREQSHRSGLFMLFFLTTSPPCTERSGKGKTTGLSGLGAGGARRSLENPVTGEALRSAAPQTRVGPRAGSTWLLHPQQLLLQRGAGAPRLAGSV